MRSEAEADVVDGMKENKEDVKGVGYHDNRNNKKK